MPISTTRGPIEAEKNPSRHINTSRVVEEDLEYLDEDPEVTQVLNAAGWAAAFEDGHQEELLFWCVLDDASVYGVALGENGRVDLTEGNVEKHSGFTGYEQANREKER